MLIMFCTICRYNGELYVDGSLVAVVDSPGMPGDIRQQFTFLGGLPNPAMFSAATDGPLYGFVGCIRAVSISGKELSITANDAVSGQNVGQCPTDPCANSGLCQDTGPLSTDFKCTCTSSFSGVTCEIFSPCNTEPCLHGGLCQLDELSPVGYRCICTALFIGPQCETSSKPLQTFCSWSDNELHSCR